MQTTPSAPLETSIHLSNDEPSSSSSSPTGEAAPTPVREAPISNEEPGTKNEEQPPRTPGRPSKMTPAAINAISHQICEFGMSDTAAAGHFGIPASTLSRWKFLNPDIELRFTSARQDFRLRQIHEIQTATTRDGRRDWRACAWLLERIFPEDYARRPGRRVDPSSEDQTWLDQARAKEAAIDHDRYRKQFEKTFSQGDDHVRKLMSHPNWDRLEGNVGCLPSAESFTAGADSASHLLPSYAAYAEAADLALRQAARISQPPPSASVIPETPPVTASPLPLPLHLHLHQETAAPTPTPAETRQITSEITETPAPAETTPAAPISPVAAPISAPSAPISTPAAPASPAAEGRPQASPRPASLTSAALGSEPTNPRPEGTAQDGARPAEIASEITETPIATPLAPTPSSIAPPDPFQNYRNSHGSPKIPTSQTSASLFPSC